MGFNTIIQYDTLERVCSGLENATGLSRLTAKVDAQVSGDTCP